MPAEEILIPTIILFAVLFMFLGTLAFFKMRLFGRVCDTQQRVSVVSMRTVLHTHTHTQVGLVYLVIYVVVVTWFLLNGIFIKFKL